jgi:hypothetical protein
VQYVTVEVDPSLAKEIEQTLNEKEVPDRSPSIVFSYPKPSLS